MSEKKPAAKKPAAKKRTVKKATESTEKKVTTAEETEEKKAPKKTTKSTEKKERVIKTAAQAKAEKAGEKVEGVAESKVKAAKAENPTRPYEQTAEVKKKTGGLRTIAIILWVLAILCEVAAIFMFNLNETTIMIILLVADAILCIVGSLLWKKSNRLSPCMSKSKFVQFIWNQMGVIACLLAFIPFGIILLTKADKLSPKMKTIVGVLFAVLFLGAVGGSIDYNPVTPEDVEKAQQEAIEAGNIAGEVYWTRWGKSYHFDMDCSTLKNSGELITGTVQEAFEAKRNDPCDFCAQPDAQENEGGDLGDVVDDLLQDNSEE